MSAMQCRNAGSTEACYVKPSRPYQSLMLLVFSVHVAGALLVCCLYGRLLALQGAAAAMYQQYQQAALNGYPDLSDQDFMMDDDTADLTPRSGRDWALDLQA
jgi:hypothetical protein